MNRKINVEFPESHISVVASLCEDAEPEMCKILWDSIKDKPLRMCCQHTLSTGHFFDAKIRPGAHPVKAGTQANPVGNHRVFLCDLKPGDLLYTLTEMSAVYGDHVTEPLQGSGTVVSKVDPEYLGEFKKAGDFVWNAQFITHKLATMVVTRKENN